MERDTNPRIVCPQTKYFGRCLEGVKSESNTTIGRSRDSSSTLSGSINSVFQQFESMAIFIYKKK